MTQQFSEGQDVEVFQVKNPISTWPMWRKAKIVTALCNKDDPENNRYEVQLSDGSRGVFDAEHIRAKTTIEDHAHNFDRPERDRKPPRTVSP